MRARHSRTSAEAAPRGGIRPAARWSALAAALLAPVLIAGCASAPAKSTGGAPSYPRALRLDGITGQQLCDSIPPEQQEDLSLSTGTPAAEEDGGAVRCSWSMRDLRRTKLTAELEIRAGGIGDSPDDEVAGFTADRRSSSRRCTIDIAAAPGKVLSAHVRPSSSKQKPKTSGSLCTEATDLAEASLATLPA